MNEREQYGGFWIRFLALMIDHTITFILGLGAGLAFGIIFGIVTHMKGIPVEEAQKSAQTYGAILGFLITFFYFTVAQALLSGTPGKLICGLRLVRADWTQVGVLQCIGRYFAMMLSSLPIGAGFVAIAFDGHCRAWHDRLAGTLVVSKDAWQKRMGEAGNAPSTDIGRAA
jgi:uncharacterized RDD family membrane protein YckC